MPGRRSRRREQRRGVRGGVAEVGEKRGDPRVERAFEFRHHRHPASGTAFALQAAGGDSDLRQDSSLAIDLTQGEREDFRNAEAGEQLGRDERAVARWECAREGHQAVFFGFSERTTCLHETTRWGLQNVNSVCASVFAAGGGGSSSTGVTLDERGLQPRNISSVTTDWRAR